MIPRLSGLTLRIVAASIALAITLLCVFVVLISAISHLRTTSREARETERVAALANRTEKLLIDLETGQRGFVITRRAVFLDPYDSARRALPRTLRALVQLVRDEPTQHALAVQIAAAIQDYENHWAALTIRIARKNQARAAALIATGAGKRRVDDIRLQFRTFLGVEQRLSDARRARADRAGTRANWMGFAGLGLAFTLIAVFALYLLHSVVQPVRNVARGARRLAEGDLSAEVPTTGAGEVGELGSDFNAMTRELKRQYSELQAVLDATFDAILMADPEGNVLFANAKMAKFWGELGMRDEGTVWDRLVSLAGRTTTPDAYYDLFARIASDPLDVISAEFTLERDKREFIGQTAPVTDSSGSLVGRIFSIRDITAERQSERAKDDFVAAVSHELRTPLTSVQGYVELLLDGSVGDLTEEQSSYLRVVDRNAARLRNIVGDLLFIAQAQAGSIPVMRERLDLVELIEHALVTARPAADDRDVRLTYDGPPRSQYDGDPTRISQVLDNLLSNAVKFTSPRTTVAVRLRQTAAGHVIDVSDEGAGIDADDQERLFDRFFRTSDATKGAVPGTGLGLSIVKAIVEAHDGTISVRSTPGSGTTFTVELSRATASRAA